jgi:hypothetical protein
MIPPLPMTAAGAVRADVPSVGIQKISKMSFRQYDAQTKKVLLSNIYDILGA